MEKKIRNIINKVKGKRYPKRKKAFIVIASSVLLVIIGAVTLLAGDTVRADNKLLLIIDTGTKGATNLDDIVVTLEITKSDWRSKITYTQDVSLFGNSGVQHVEKEEVRMADPEMVGYELAKTTTSPAVSGYINYVAAGWFKPNSQEYFLLTASTGGTIDETARVTGVKSVSVKTKDNFSWTIRGFRIINVGSADKYREGLYCLTASAPYSDAYYASYAGEIFYDAELGGGTTISTSKAGSLTLKNKSGDDKHSVSFIGEKEYIFKIDIADVYDAPISSDTLPNGGLRSLSKLLMKEHLVLNLRYKDPFGIEKEAHYPFTVNAEVQAVNSLGSASSGQVCGIFQQGQSVAFKVKMGSSELGEITGLTLTYADDVDDSATIVTETSATLSNGRGYAPIRAVSRVLYGEKLEGDLLRYNAFYIYDGSKSKLTYKLDGLMLQAEVSGTPLYYYASTTSDGTEIVPNTVHNVWANLKKYPGSGSFTPSTKTSGTRYLVLLHTDTVYRADTVEPMSCVLHYKNYTGVDKETSKFNLRDESLKMYGMLDYQKEAVYDSDVIHQVYYAPEYGAYGVGTSAGGTLAFVISLPDCDYFTGITVYMPTNSQDDWQMSGMEIWYLKSLGSLKMELNDGTLIPKSQTDRLPKRDYEKAGNYRILNYKDQSKKLYINSNLGEVTLSFKSESGITTHDIDWESIKNSMTFEEASQDFGFTKIRRSYTVNVNVASDGSISNDDSGSENKFYFQLIFEGGVSGYVLANQQLASDRFRAGKEESFVINTNLDYGAVTGIRVIPDDISESSAAYDKMNIDSIHVVQGSNGALSRKWIISDVGWIGIDYNEEGAKSTASGQLGRSEAEISKSYLVSATGYSMNLLFAVSTGKRAPRIPLSSSKMSMIATIGYTNVYDIEGEKRVDIAKACCEYAKLSPTLKSDGSAIVQNWMVNEEHTARFTCGFDEIKSIDYITIEIRDLSNGTPYYWDIADISVFQIKSEGLLNINIFGEYQKTDETERICGLSNKNVSWGPMKGSATKKFQFEENTIEVNTDTSTWTSAVTRVPVNETDVLNVYVFMDPGTDPISKYEMNGSVFYHKSSDEANEYKASFKNMQRDVKNNMFYATGISAGGLTTIPSVNLQATKGNNAIAKVDHVIIQQIRSGVAIRTYGFKFGKTVEIPGGYTADYFEGIYFQGIDGKQTVSLQISPDSAVQGLEADGNDLAVAIKYTTDYDPTGTVYSSKYIFLTDEGYDMLKCGQIVRLEFNEACVKEIKGLTVAAAGNVKSKIDLATVSTEKEEKDGTFTREKVYSFNTAIVPAVTPRTVSPASGDIGSVGYIGFKFKTASLNTVIPEKIELVIHYLDAAGNPATRTITDLSPYISNGSLASGESFDVELMIGGMTEFRYIEINPTDNDPKRIAAWTLESADITVQVGFDSKIVKHVLNATIYEDEPRHLNVADINLTVVSLIYDEKTDSYDRRTFRSGLSESAEGVIVKATSEIRFEVSQSGSFEDVNVVVKRVVNGSTVEDNECISKIELLEKDTEAGNSEYEVIFRSAEGRAAEYQITFSSSEMSDVSVTVNIVAEAEAQG